MTTTLDRAARGLRLTHVGFLLTVWGAASSIVLWWFIAVILRYSDDSWWLFVGMLGLNLLTTIAGVVVGLVGRFRSLALPEGLPSVRAKAVLAVVLETCGWGSLLAGVGVLIAVSVWFGSQWIWLPLIGLIASGLMLIGGRVMFLRFLGSLALVVEDGVARRRSRLALTLFLVEWAAGLIALGIVWGGYALNIYQMTNPLGQLIWLLIGMSGLYGLLVYDRLLGGLMAAMQKYDADLDRDEP